MSLALNDNPTQSYRVSPTTWDHTVLPATWCRWTCSTLTPTRQAVHNLLILVGWKVELILVVGYTPRWFTCSQTVTRPGSNYLIARLDQKLKQCLNNVDSAFYPPWDGKMSSNSFTCVTKGGDLGTADWGCLAGRCASLCLQAAHGGRAAGGYG